MSALITGGGVVYGLGEFNASDDSVQMQQDRYQLVRGESYSDFQWVRSQFPVENSNINDLNDAAHQYWEWNWPPNRYGMGLGHSGRKKISGVVRNSEGSPVSGATVDLFNSASGAIVDTQTSAADGSYTCGDPNAVNCFAVADLAGSPETAGTTVQTLTGT